MKRIKIPKGMRYLLISKSKELTFVANELLPIVGFQDTLGGITYHDGKKIQCRYVGSFRLDYLQEIISRATNYFKEEKEDVSNLKLEIYIEKEKMILAPARIRNFIIAPRLDVEEFKKPIIAKGTDAL